MRVALFRWKAIVPLLVFGALVLVLWILFADRLAKSAAESVGTRVIGAKVEIGTLHLDARHGRMELHGLTVASPFDGFKNLFQAEELVADVAPAPLLEKKVVIDRLAAKGLRFGTPRQTDGRTAGQADGVMGQVERWAGQLQVPALQLVTGKISVGQLDPAQLAAPRAAAALAARVDSTERAWNAALAGLDVSATIDSTRRTVERLRGAKPTDLKVLADARRTLDQVKRTRDGLASLERSVSAGGATLQTGLTDVNQAKERDYAAARALLKLPGLDAPDIGAAVFGPAAVDRFRRALYWAELGRRYMPPGLRPQATPGPKRVRRGGTTVRFPREHAYPAFLIKAAELSVELAGGRTYAARLAGLASDPTLYGRPATLVATAPGVRAGALVDHVKPTPRDTAGGSIAGVELPPFALGSLPVRIDPGSGTVGLSFALTGDTVRARWSVSSERVRWARDTSTAGSQLGDLAWRAVSGISSLELTASLGGTLAQPRLAVSSNLDRALAERIRAVAGEEIAAAERKVRAEVDSIVERQAGPVRARAAALTGDITKRLGAERARLDEAQKALERRLRLPGLRVLNP